MTFSSKTIDALAKAIAPEILESVSNDSQFSEFMFDALHEVVQKRLGLIDEDVLSELTCAIFTRTCLIDTSTDFNFNTEEAKLWEDRYKTLLGYVKKNFSSDYVDGAEYGLTSYNTDA